MSKIIEVNGLKKAFGEVKAVKGIDFYVDSGTLFAFLGPNGAGKSTTIDIICTLLEPDGGEAEICGYSLKDARSIRQEIGVVFQDGLLDKRLTVRENLTIRGGFYGLSGAALKKAVNAAAENTGCTEYMGRQYGKLSGGQRRRADIARALVNTPKVLFLDEPTTGLDPATRKNVWETVKSLQKNSGTTVFLTTHYMEEAAGADYVAVIDNGIITAKGTPSQLREKYSRDHLYMTPKNMAAFMRKLEAGKIKYEIKAETVSIEIPDTLSAIPLISDFKKDIEWFEVKSGSMDDAFINITGGIA